MKYWEVIANNLAHDNWSYGYTPFLTREGEKLVCVDAQRVGRRFIVHAEDLQTAFLGLANQCRDEEQEA